MSFKNNYWFKKKIRIKLCTQVITNLFTDDELKQRPFAINDINYNKVELIIDFKGNDSSYVSGEIIKEQFFENAFMYQLEVL